MTQEPDLPALPEPDCFGLLKPDRTIDAELLGSREDCEYWTRAEKEPQNGWEIVRVYDEHKMRAYAVAAVLADRAQRVPLTEFQRMQIIGDEFPISLVQSIVIQKVDSVVLAVERAHGIGTPPAKTLTVEDITGFRFKQI